MTFLVISILENIYIDKNILENIDINKWLFLKIWISIREFNKISITYHIDKDLAY